MREQQFSSSLYFLIWATTQTYKPYTSTRFFVPIIAITPLEQVLAVPDLEFLVRFHRAVVTIRLWPKAGCKTCSPKNLIGNHSLGEEDYGFCQLSTWPFGWE